MLSLFFAILVVNNEYQTAYVNIAEIQAIEVVDIDDDSGVLTITLKGDKSEDLAFKCNDIEKWEQTKEFLIKSMYDISKIMSNNNLDVNLSKEQF
tara:strand:- start:2925 stop:3209 length:285 start_codon:yes stop_codon:yes gene_type:complete